MAKRKLAVATAGACCNVRCNCCPWALARRSSAVAMAIALAVQTPSSQGYLNHRTSAQGTVTTTTTSSQRCVLFSKRAELQLCPQFQCGWGELFVPDNVCDYEGGGPFSRIDVIREPGRGQDDQVPTLQCLASYLFGWVLVPPPLWWKAESPPFISALSLHASRFHLLSFRLLFCCSVWAHSLLATWKWSQSVNATRSIVKTGKSGGYVRPDSLPDSIRSK